jgi:Asp-tRNA(Asn)/Glu-tRNA(Gln) amidotransferase A subunit family amidase
VRVPSGPASLDATEAARRIAAGALTSEALVAACLDRIAERDPEVRAWAQLAAAAALAEARARDRQRPSGLLHGVPLGVKDIFDTAGLPTEYGSPLYAGHRPALDASPFAALRAAGALVLGKTVTTEFAYLAPGPTRNPHDSGHTPGGSSSGSAAAVADYHAPLALGTQTGGSVIRPAAYCGVYGFKPTYGFVDAGGVRPLATALDTVGWLARSVEDLALLGAVLNPAQSAALEPPAEPPLEPRRIGVVRTADWEQISEAMRDAIEGVAGALADAGWAVAEVAWPAECGGLGGAWEAVIAAGAASAFASEYEQHRDGLGVELRELIERGRALSGAERGAAESLALQCRALVSERFADFDAFLTPAVAGVAPEGLASTGNPLFNRNWTLLRLPCVAIPAGSDARGLPVGVQLVGRHGGDQALLEVARHLDRIVNP